MRRKCSPVTASVKNNTFTLYCDMINQSQWALLTGGNLRPVTDQSERMRVHVPGAGAGARGLLACAPPKAGELCWGRLAALLIGLPQT